MRSKATNDTPPREQSEESPLDLVLRCRPMLATAGSLPADESAYGFEFKWDGARCLAAVEGTTMRLLTRNGIDVTHRYPELASLPTIAAGHNLLLDGEIVALDNDDRPSFARLQRRLHLQDAAEIARVATEIPVALLLFDILQLDGRWLAPLSYRERRKILDALDLGGDHISTPPWFPGEGGNLLAAAERSGLEGVVAKRLESPYRQDYRSDDWIKVKVRRRQEFVIAGYLPGKGAQTGRVGSLLLGYYPSPPKGSSARTKEPLRYAGNVGTGFSDLDRAALKRELDTREISRSPFDGRTPARAVFSEPVLIAEVAFHNWTRDGMLRHPVFLGLRDDKSPADVHREE